MANKNIIVHSYTDDVVESRNQNYKIPESYQWVPGGKLFRVFSGILYRAARALGIIYCKFFLHVNIKNRKVLEEGRDTGFFLFANHTQEMGDVFLPAWAVRPKRIYTVASTANMGIPVIGKLLPAMGMLPLPDSISQMKQFRKAIELRIREKCCVVIYPEAHVWPYYTKIRPFPDTSFRFPLDEDVPSFCMTTTYQKRGNGRKPGITVYLDGPFRPEKSGHRKNNQKLLRDRIYECMQERSKRSDYEYIHYEKQ